MTDDNPYACSQIDDLPPPRRGPWLLCSVLIGGLGVALFIGGLIYGISKVGMPAQDPTPEYLEYEAFHTNISSWIMAIGGFVVLISIVSAAAVVVYRAATISRPYR